MSIKTLWPVVLLSSALGVGCDSGGSSEPGIQTTIKAVAQSGRPHAETGEDARLDKLIFRRSDGTKIELQVGLLNLVPIELNHCESTAGLSVRPLLDALNPVATAYAHGGIDGSAPAGAISVADEEAELGRLSAAPGRYCGLVVEIRTSSVPDTGLSNAAISVSPCYYAGAIGLSDEEAEAVTAHHCILSKFSIVPYRFTLPFGSAVTLDSAKRQLDLTVLVRYEEWFDGLDFELLKADPEEQARLRDNIAAAMHVVTDDEQSLTLGFKMHIGSKEAVCAETYEALGSGTGHRLRMQDYRFYASNFELSNSSDTQAVKLAAKPNRTVLRDGSNSIALLGQTLGCNALIGLRNLTLSGTVKKGEYDRLCFTLGVPYAQTYANSVMPPRPLGMTGMEGHWRFGHKFFRFDALADPAGAAAPFSIHLASTECGGADDPDSSAPPAEDCAYPNRPRVCLDYTQIAEGYSIIADVAPLMAELDVTRNTADTEPGCTSLSGDPECVTVLPQFGLDYAFDPPELIPRRAQTLFTTGK